jgi:phosphomannomutase
MVAGPRGPSWLGLRAQAEAWIAADPDPGDRAELAALLAAAGSAPGAAAELSSRFDGRLSFGTAGLRGVVAAGPNRMNRAVVRTATAALAWWLSEHRPGAARAGVAIGCDARHRSAEFADETASVLAGAGIAVHLLPYQQPTPLLAFAVRHLGAAAGVMITASHNPVGDNGYKLYLGDGAQIVPPVDAEIESAMAAVTRLADVPVAPLDHSVIIRHGDEIAQAYLDAICALCPAPPGARPLRVIYTPLHGVAGRLAAEAFTRAGFAAPEVVAGQAEPDPSFPTVAFPNPQEPGALDLALAQARCADADLVLANDPDGDRLAVAVPAPAAPGGWRALTGDEVGALLGAGLLERSAAEPDPQPRLMVSTVVSGSLLAKIAVAAGARHVETLTGFKWIMRAAEQQPAARFMFGYEEALGYAVGDVVRDKDGISAALAVMGLAASTPPCGPAGSGLLARLDALEITNGAHATGQYTLLTSEPGTVMTRLRSDPPGSFAGEPVTEATDLAAGPAGLPRADVLIYRLDGARIAIRPSGTEPKLKAYLEVVQPVSAPARLDQARAAAHARLARLRAALRPVLAP